VHCISRQVNLYSGALFIKQSIGWDLYTSVTLLVFLTGILTVTGKMPTETAIATNAVAVSSLCSKISCGSLTRLGLKQGSQRICQFLCRVAMR